MKLLLLAACVLAAAPADSAHTHAPPTTTPKPLPTEDRVKALEDIMSGLSRQVMLQQFYLEEKIRSDGSSGIKSVRVNQDGNKNYHAAAHLDSRFLVMHDHPNYDRTPGMGELMVVMNGVEFKTRHNDYKLRMPCKNCTDYHKMENIPFPPIPPSVLALKNVTEAVQEMREYYRAFQEQDITIRDYRPYFKANLCYLEGAWATGTKTLVDPFESDRHSIDASSWFDLMDKARFTSLTGSKSVLENFAFLPTNIQSVDDKGNPTYVQWSYRILCHPLKDDLPTKYFEQDDDLMYRFPYRRTMDKVSPRAKRFHLNKKPGVDHHNNGRGLIDALMAQVPGKDNYPAKLYDHSFDMVMEDVRYNNHTLINSGYYNRYFKTMDKGAMGLKSIHRGFSDSNLWVALTTHPQVAPISVNSCHREGTGHNRHQVCKTFTNRMTYALPLEVIYTTPVQSWNPYDLATDQNVNNIVVEHGKRNGQPELATAFNGTSPKKYNFLLPAEFFESISGPRDPADTAKRGAGVLDKNGDMKICESSGIRVETPNIAGVGKVRLRYGIMPVHGEGSNMWKELNALKDMTMHLNRYASLFEERPGSAVANTTDESALLHFRVQETIQDPPGEHGHDIFLNNEELDEIKKGIRMLVTTSEDLGHTHELELRWNNRRHYLYMNKCDGLHDCWDGHSRTMVEIK